ncbi:TRAP-type C4-dicarboxylate transport system, small permease component [Modicisalibacter ilicicola DSM 19980]|uniref:TRAP transporter small permease protein n=1 Tax=Modicisalibacter ilicicola DSM 19980 TaxID=1121942 RepID=A0A1M4ZP15_9GAMM|nr:TRAP transporter small permease [Halomonas ilicicola]SHF19744.1 TRAP-type C4-dicarboxylate transport system, small permease component [Halomonas ilicicola DSM 19980]
MSEDRVPHSADTFEFLEEDEFNWRDYAIEDYVTLVVFWLLAIDVFLQFFSRYVLGSSIAWTEEMARYLLVVVCFLGSAMAVRKGSHIAVEFFYRYMPGRVGLTMSTLVDIVRVIFFIAGSWITYKLADRTNAMMVSVDIPKSVIYYLVLVGFLLMLLRSIQAAIRHWREGTSELIFTEDDG